MDFIQTPTRKINSTAERLTYTFDGSLAVIDGNARRKVRGADLAIMRRPVYRVEIYRDAEG